MHISSKKAKNAMKPKISQWNKNVESKRFLCHEVLVYKHAPAVPDIFKTKFRFLLCLGTLALDKITPRSHCLAKSIRGETCAAQLTDFCDVTPAQHFTYVLGKRGERLLQHYGLF